MLEFATEGCCKGHKCDNCAMCRKGRCCRRDNPDYKLPELGEWDGPIYGELGVLNDDGEKVECHCCGKWFGHLGSHIVQKHDLTAAEYKSIFGLNNTTGLIGPALQHIRALGFARSLGMYTERTPATPEQLLQMAMHPRRMQTRLAMSKHNFGAGKQQGRIAERKRGQVAGVYKARHRYVARIGYQHAVLYLGTYDTVKEAARAYDAKARELYGDQARLNFPKETS